jgi:hypothetical protein
MKNGEAVERSKTVMPAKAGIQNLLKILDEPYASFYVRIESVMTKKGNLTFYEAIKSGNWKLKLGGCIICTIMAESFYLNP